MAFERNQIARMGSSQTNGLPTGWMYKPTIDTLVDIKVPSYFNDFRPNFVEGDYIFVQDPVFNVDILTALIDVGGNIIVTSYVSGAAGGMEAVAKIAGTVTTVGGSATETISVPGINTFDRPVVMIKVPGNGTVYLRSADITSLDEIDLTFNEDPLASTQVNYIVFSNT